MVVIPCYNVPARSQSTSAAPYTPCVMSFMRGFNLSPLHTSPRQTLPSSRAMPTWTRMQSPKSSCSSRGCPPLSSVCPPICHSSWLLPSFTLLAKPGTYNVCTYYAAKKTVTSVLSLSCSKGSPPRAVTVGCSVRRAVTTYTQRAVPPQLKIPKPVP